MAVISVTELSEGRGGEFAAQRGSAMRVFRVVTDNRYDGESTVGNAAGLPRYLNPHPENFFLKCKTLKPSLEHGRTVWLVKAAYDNEPIDEETQNKLIENPLLRPAKIRWESARYSMPVDKDADGKALVNAAGKMFDPPIERDSATRAARITKNVAAVPLWLLDYEDSLNESAFSIDGVNVLPRCAKIGGLRISEKLKENEISFRTIEMDIEFRRPPDVVIGQVRNGATRQPAADVQGWDYLQLNQGLQERVSDSDGELVDPPEWKNIEVENGDANSPQPLDEDGRALRRHETGDLIWLRWDLYPRKDYSVISALWS